MCCAVDWCIVLYIEMCASCNCPAKKGRMHATSVELDIAPLPLTIDRTTSLSYCRHVLLETVGLERAVDEDPSGI